MVLLVTIFEITNSSTYPRWIIRRIIPWIGLFRKLMRAYVLLFIMHRPLNFELRAIIITCTIYFRRRSNRLGKLSFVTFQTGWCTDRWLVFTNSTGRAWFYSSTRIRSRTTTIYKNYKITWWIFKFITNVLNYLAFHLL